MNYHYEDIRSRISESPRWFDEEAVPRYCDFSPKSISNIYADECALVLISCQGCETAFRVAFSASRSAAILAQARGQVYRTIADLIRDSSLHYGDPPNVDCCPAGPTMNCNDIRVLEYWRRLQIDWERDPSLEVALADHP